MNDQALDFTPRVTRGPASAILRSGRRLWALLPLLVLVSAFGQSDNVTHEIANLKDSDYRIRASAAGTLGAMKDPRAVAPLVLALNDTFAAVRSAAIESLAMLKDPRAIKALIPLSTDENTEIRTGAILALGEFQDQRAVAALIAALNRSNETDEGVPSSSLGRIGALAVDPLVAQLKSGNPDVRTRAVNALGWIEVPRAFDALIPALKDTNSNVRAAAVAAIYGSRDAPGMLLTPFDFSGLLHRRDPTEARDPRVIGVLIAALQDADRKVRSIAAEKLGELETPRAVVPLLALLNTPVAKRAAEVEVRISAVEALGQIKDPRAVQSLISTLKDPDERVREKAAAALVNLADPAAVEPLIAFLSDANETVRVSAAQVLGKIKDPRSVEPLAAALHDTSFRVAGNAAIALGEIGDVRAAPVLVAALKELRSPVLDGDGVLGALQAIGAPAIGALSAAGRDPNPDVRARAFSALGGIADDGAVAALVAGLHDNEVRVRAAAAGALAWSRNPRAEPSVLAAVKDKADEVRQSAIQGLCANDSAWAIGPLVAALRDPVSGFAEYCLHASPDGIRRPITEPFLSLLKDPDGWTRGLAAEALSQQVMTHMMLRSFREPADLRAIDALLALLKAGDSDAVWGAYMFFVALGEPGSEDGLIEALRRHVDETTAGYLLTCGNAKLEEAARARLAGQDTSAQGILIGPTWGSGRQWLLSSPVR